MPGRGFLRYGCVPSSRYAKVPPIRHTAPIQLFSRLATGEGPPPPSFSAHVPPFPASAQKRKTTFRHSPKSFACLHENLLSSSCAPGALRFEPPFLRHACRVRRPAFRFCPAPAPRLKRRICSFCNRYVQDYNKNCHKRLRLFVNHIIYFHKIIKKLP